jgi:hypothetical protein
MKVLLHRSDEEYRDRITSRSYFEAVRRRSWGKAVERREESTEYLPTHMNAEKQERLLFFSVFSLRHPSVCRHPVTLTGKTLIFLTRELCSIDNGGDYDDAEAFECNEVICMNLCGSNEEKGSH